MLCDSCGREQATVHLTEITGEQMSELHLCEDCARKKGGQIEQPFGLQDLLSGLADLGTGAGPEVAGGVQCPSCGMAYDEFRRVGRLGCGACYQAFQRYLLPLLKRIHGAGHHHGKHPPRERAADSAAGRGGQELQKLKERLQRAIDHEAFEEAAALRDRIKQLEKKRP